MVAAELGVALVEGDGEQVAVLGGGCERPVEDGLDLEGGAHAAQREVAEPQLIVGQPCVAASVFEGAVELSARLVRSVGAPVAATMSAASRRRGMSASRDVRWRRAVAASAERWSRSIRIPWAWAITSRAWRASCKRLDAFGGGDVAAAVGEDARRVPGDQASQLLLVRAEAGVARAVEVEGADGCRSDGERRRQDAGDPRVDGVGNEVGPAGLFGGGLDVGALAVRGGEHAGPLPGRVLIAVQADSGVVARRHRDQPAPPARGHAGAVGAGDRGRRQRDDQSERGVDGALLGTGGRGPHLGEGTHHRPARPVGVRLGPVDGDARIGPLDVDELVHPGDGEHPAGEVRRRSDGQPARGRPQTSGEASDEVDAAHAHEIDLGEVQDHPPVAAVEHGVQVRAEVWDGGEVDLATRTDQDLVPAEADHDIQRGRGGDHARHRRAYQPTVRARRATGARRSCRASTARNAPQCVAFHWPCRVVDTRR